MPCFATSRRAAVVSALLAVAACGGPGGTDAGPDTGAADTGVDHGGTDLGPDAPPCADADSDGHPAMSCGGDDCDDTDPNRYPGNTEICDAAGHDEDCDPATLGPDADGDGATYVGCCNGTTCGTDCNDHAATIGPTAVESCNGVDDDCDGMVDEMLRSTFCADGDGDAHGDLATAISACSMPIGSTNICNDCDDMAPARHPGQTELCNGIDDNCDGIVDEGCACTMGMSRVCGMTRGACVSGIQGCPSGTWETACTGGVFPMLETCNGIDDDCDGETDEGTTFTFYEDCDADGYGRVGSDRVACVAPPGVPPGCAHGVWSMVGGDCADTDPTMFPGAGCAIPMDGGVDAGPTDAGVDLGPVDMGPMCTLPRVACPGVATCVDTTTDMAHCGSCATPCGWSHCVSSTCNDATAVFAGGAPAGGTDTCALRSDGAVACWGSNSSGKEAIGDTATHARPTASMFTGATQIAIGHWSACAIIGGNVECAGDDANYVLGDGPTTHSSSVTTPLTVALPMAATQVAVGQYHACALLVDHSLRCWGTNLFGGLADGTMTDRNAPVAATGFGSTVTQVAVGDWYTCVVKMDNSVWCAGHGTSGQLGDGSMLDTATPVMAALAGPAFAVAAATTGGFGGHTCAALMDGTLQCWGDNAARELGDGTTTPTPTPITVPGISDVAQVVEGSEFACVRTNAGTVWCWGSNLYYQFGVGAMFTTVPMMATGMTDAADLAAGGDVVCAVRATGGVVCAGGSMSAGTGFSANVFTPTLAPP